MLTHILSTVFSKCWILHPPRHTDLKTFYLDFSTDVLFQYLKAYLQTILHRTIVQSFMTFLPQFRRAQAPLLATSFAGRGLGSFSLWNVQASFSFTFSELTFPSSNQVLHSPAWASLSVQQWLRVLLFAIFFEDFCSILYIHSMTIKLSRLQPARTYIFQLHQNP